MELNLSRIGRVQGALVTLGPILAIFIFGLTNLMPGQDPMLLLAIAACISVSFGGAIFSIYPRTARLLCTAGLSAILYILFPQLSVSPALALAASIIVSIGLGYIWVTRALPFRSTKARVILHAQTDHEAFRIASIGAPAAWLLALGMGLAFHHMAQVAVITSILFSVALGIRWSASDRRKKGVFQVWLLVSLALFFFSALLLQERRALLITLWLIFPLGSLILTRGREDRPLFDFFVELTLEHPARLLVFTFSALSIIGAFLLYLPESSALPGSVGFINALFTAVSAVCVTGLIVLDTPNDFNFLGQAVILAGIQIGGLGIMTFYTAAFTLLGRRFSVRHERVLGTVLGGDYMGEVVSSIRKILTVTFVSEVIGAALLTFAFFKAGDSIDTAFWRGVFTAVSAFCNAGFALQSDSLVAYQEHPLVLHTTATLIIIGSLSPIAVTYIPKFLKGLYVPLQTKLIFYSSVFLLVGGTIGIMAFEWANTLQGMTFWDSFHNAWFQSASIRTAGFNSIDISAFQPTTLVITLALMWIGGSPGGTAGGVKTTTVALLLLAVVSAFRGIPKVVIFGRAIPHSSIYRSAAVVSASVIMALFGFLALLLTQAIPTDILFFELISALGTVGLSMGATGELDQVGKVIIIACMFAGRVGPLTLLLLLSSYGRERQEWRLPEEEVAVG